MSTTNRYVKNSKISEAKFREIVKYFAFDLDAQMIALLTKLNRNTVNRYLALIRQRIADFCEEESPFHGEIEVDESYFGAKRVKGKRGRGAGRKPLYSVSCNEKVVSIPKSFPIAPGRLSKLLSEARLNRIASYIQIGGEATMVWLTWGTKSITVFTMETTNLPEEKVTSMVLSPSGHLQNEGS